LISATLPTADGPLQDSGELIVASAPPEVTAVSIFPPRAVIPLGGTQDYRALAEFDDGSRANVTFLGEWSLANQPPILQPYSGAPLGGVTPALDEFGTALAVAVGSDVLRFEYEGLQAEADVTVTDAALLEITISPRNERVAVGTLTRFSAEGTFTDGSRRDITDAVTWASSNAAVASISNQSPARGEATALRVGDTTISATLSGVTDSTGLRVNNDPVLRIEVSPSEAVIPTGAQQAFAAQAVYASGDTQDVTQEAAWRSSNETIATIDQAGLAQGESAGSVDIVAAFAGTSGVARLTVEQNITLESITVEPAASTLLPLQTLQLRAYGNYSDGSVRELTNEVTWSSNDRTTVAVSKNDLFGRGLALALLPGAAEISAALPGDPSTIGTASIVVLPLPGIVEKLEVNPALATIVEGETLDYEAVLVLSSGREILVTDFVSWRSSDTAVATLQAGGVAFGESAGSATITATLPNTSFSNTADLTVVAGTVVEQIVVTPAKATVPAGKSQRYLASAQLSNGEVVDVSSDVDWSTGDGSVAVVSGDGNATGLAPGETTVTALLDTGSLRLTGSALIEVTPATVTDLAVSPATATIGVGESLAYRANAQLSDGTLVDVTNTANWQSSDNAIAQLAPGGIATGTGQGDAIVTATLAGEAGDLQATAALQVSGLAIEEIRINPRQASTLVGETTAFVASAVLADGSERDITNEATWFVADPAIASVSSGRRAGTVTGLSSGDTAVFVEYSDGFSVFPCEGLASCEAALTVSDPVIAQRLDVTPASAEVLIDSTVRFGASLVLSNGEVLDVSNAVSWSSSNSSIAALQSQSGEFIGLSEGIVTITAQGDYQGSLLTGTAELTVTPPAITVDRLEVVPASTRVFVGDTGRFEALAYLSNGEILDVTFESRWASSDTSVGVIEPDTGLGTALAPGETEISAEFIYDGISRIGRSTVTVIEAAPDLLEVAPKSATLAAGDTLQYGATLYYEDGRDEPATENVTWRSSDETIAFVSNLPGGKGEVTALAEGQAEIQAEHGSGLTSFGRLTVIAPALVSLSVDPPDETLIEGQSTRLTALATFSDETVLDVTSEADWSSDASSVASVSNQQATRGTVTGNSAGAATITASYQGSRADSAISVLANALQSGWIEPSQNTLQVGDEQNYRAFAEFLDGSTRDITDSSIWQSSNPDIASVGNGSSRSSLQPKGRVLALVEGNTDIFANFEGVLVGTSPLRVEGLTAIALEVDPDTLQLVPGDSAALRATVRYDNGASEDVTEQALWGSANIDVADVSNASGRQGVVEAVSPGNTVIIAGYDSLTASVAVEVVAVTCQGKPSGIVIDSGDQTIQEGQTVRFTVRATYPNGCVEDITESNQTVWQSRAKTICNFESPKGGVATGLREGVATVEAKHRSLTATATCTVIPRANDCDLDQNELPDSIYILEPKVIAVGEQTRFEARAIWRNGACETDVTGSPFLQWRTLNGGEQICSIVPQTGVATGKREGVSDIQAAYNGGRNADTTCTVEAGTTPSPCGPEWEISGAVYNVGDQVSFDGQRYRCIQSHTTYGDPNWRPPNTPNLWEPLGSCP
jgi:uncharacterized protein YjdB